MSASKYVHGYSQREKGRLYDQANTLSGLLHKGTSYPARSRVLELGCGVGAQTIILANNSPKARFFSVDISPESLKQAEAVAKTARVKNVVFQKADVYKLPFAKSSFDHIFVCFVLEHLDRPLRALKNLKTVLKKGGTITVIEGDHGSAYFYPDSPEARLTIKCLIEVQALLKGDSLIGRELFPLLKKAGFKKIRVSPKMVYVDGSKPDLVLGFTKNTFIAMVEGVKDQSLRLGLIDARTWDKGIKDLYRTAAPTGTFCYSFFKAEAVK